MSFAPRVELARDPDRERLMRPLRRERHRIEPDRRALRRARQVIDDPPAEEIAVGKMRKRLRQRVDRQPAQPQRHARGLRHVGERTALDRGRDRACSVGARAAAPRARTTAPENSTQDPPRADERARLPAPPPGRPAHIAAGAARCARALRPHPRDRAGGDRETA